MANVHLGALPVSPLAACTGGRPSRSKPDASPEREAHPLPSGRVLPIYVQQMITQGLLAMDETQLVTALVAGAAIAGAELVKETTKEAYRGLKIIVSTMFGTRAQRAIEKVEAAPDDASARRELAHFIPTLSGSRTEPNCSLLIGRTFLLALVCHPASQANPPIGCPHYARQRQGWRQHPAEYLEGASDIDVKAEAGEHFVLRAA